MSHYRYSIAIRTRYGTFLKLIYIGIDYIDWGTPNTLLDSRYESTKTSHGTPSGAPRPADPLSLHRKINNYNLSLE